MPSRVFLSFLVLPVLTGLMLVGAWLTAPGPEPSQPALMEEGSAEDPAMNSLRGAPPATQEATPSGNWTHYGGNTKNWKYQPFDQINATNFGTLEVAWRFKTDNMRRQPECRLGATPLMVDGVVYAVGGGMRRSVVPLEADTGALVDGSQAARPRVVVQRNARGYGW